MKSKPVDGDRRTRARRGVGLRRWPELANFGLVEFAPRFGLVAERLLAGASGRGRAPVRPNRSERWTAGF